MSDWKPLTVENIIRAECIFVSVGYRIGEIKDKDFLWEYGEHWIEQYAQEGFDAMRSGKREYEFIFCLPDSFRCRMYLYNGFDELTKRKFPGAEYMLGVTHMNHFDAPEYEVEELFSSIERKLLDEKFPALKF